MRRFAFCLLILPVLALSAYADAFLGTAGSFAVLGAQTVTNTLVCCSTLTGSLGVSPGTAITNLADVNVNGVNGTISTDVHLNDPVAIQAQADALTAYNTLAGLATSGPTLLDNLTSDVVGVGVYHLGAASLDSGGVLTLDFGNSLLTNQNIVFQTDSSLITGSGSSVEIINANATDNVFWQVGSSATLGSSTSFVGNIIALTSVTMVSTAKDLCGSVIALNAAVTLDNNTISNGCAAGTGGGGGGTVIGGGTGGGPGVPLPEGGSTLVYLGFLLVPIGAAQAFRGRRSEIV